jgi:TetR/AcrR family transcriptional regulator
MRHGAVCSQGIRRTSIRDLCDAAAISRPVLYYFYGSKQGLFRAVIRRACRHFTARLAAALNGNCGFRDKCRGLVELLFQDAIENPRLWRLMVASIWSPGVSANSDLAALRSKFSRKLNAEAMKAVVRGELRDSADDVSVPVLFGTLAFVVVNFLGTGKPDAFDLSR